MYVFVVGGNVEVEGQPLSVRDGYGFWPESVVSFKSLEKSSLLVMEVPEKW
ncbi:hypothetical protein D3C86_2068170 [compost metagenome]